MNKLIIACRGDAFGERILALLNAIYISKKVNLKFGYIWNVPRVKFNVDKVINPFDDFPSEKDIFNEDFIHKYSLTDKVNFIAKDGIGIFLKNKKYVLKTIHEYEQSCEYGYISTQYDLSDLCIDVDKIEYLNLLKKIFWNEIGFSNKVINLIALVEKSINFNFYAIHIRIGDILLNNDGKDIFFGRKKASELCLILEVINKTLKDKNIVIFGDDLELIRLIKTKSNNLNNRFVLLPSECINIHISGFDKNFSDVILMSNSNGIYASGSSGFSQLAYRISRNCNSIVSIYDLFTINEQYSIICSRVKSLQGLKKEYQSFSYFYLYLLSNKLSMSYFTQRKHLINAMSFYPNCKTYSILYINLLLDMNKLKELNLLFKERYSYLFLEDSLFFINAYNNKFLYSFIFVKLLKIKDLILYPYIGLFLREMFKGKKIDNSYLENIFKNSKERVEYNDMYNSLYHFFLVSYNTSDTILIGAKERVKNHLAYKLGRILIDNKKNVFKMFFKIFQTLIFHKIIKIKYGMICKFDSKYKLPSLDSYSDKEEGFAIKNYYSYRLGELFIKHPFSFIFRIYNFNAKFRREKNGNKI
ncbi:TPA: hypothetical protein SCU98_001841 [Campylobacter jejuni]|uniref:Putative glycosyltransferase n=1 Tax=Campylobacter jejuni subsp. jejuni TaxID=32022 RepID=A0A0S2CGL4_CAMJU|nr:MULTISPECIES: hypothetical protein [Campylobacter]ALN43855.1 putative glycosyltransferase [Campylobacter jejuni subsp. jejuni]TEY42435.1 hypothetical protein ELQ27_00385 [Campylobacter sp. CH185]EAJ8980781.1 hypothetical protein [Campylobacter jejuni]EAJ9013874.1 hypothetical protein [Campylobacter jejuni]EFP5531162.1 hypothetical protein [Campylobacter jejuni]